MENFKEIAEKCLKGELSGTFITRIGEKIPSYKLRRNDHVVYKYQLGTVNTYSDEGKWHLKYTTKLDIINFIPDKDMETKEIKIKVPEGYEIDKELSSFEKIIFKKKETKYPESWEELIKNKKKYKKSGFFIDEYSRIYPVDFDRMIDLKGWRNTLPTKEIAEKFLAYMQLMSLRHEWIHIWSQEQGLEKDWEPVY